MEKHEHEMPRHETPRQEAHPSMAENLAAAEKSAVSEKRATLTMPSVETLLALITELRAIITLIMEAVQPHGKGTKPMIDRALVERAQAALEEKV
jgi:hypothetical protein